MYVELRGICEKRKTEDDWVLFNNYWDSIGCWWTCAIYQGTVAPNCSKSHTNWLLISKKKLSDVRSKIHRARRNTVCTRQFVRAVKKIIFRLVTWIFYRGYYHDVYLQHIFLALKQFQPSCKLSSCLIFIITQCEWFHLLFSLIC